LQTAAAAVGGAIVTGHPGSASSLESVEGFPPPTRLVRLPEDDSYCDRLRREADEIINYYRRYSLACDAAGFTRSQPLALQLPFATYPINQYWGPDSEEVAKITDKLAPPKIPVLMQSLDFGGQADIQIVLDMLWSRYGLQPKYKTRMVNRSRDITTKPPQADRVYKSRIITPKFVCDVEDMHEKKLAIIIYRLHSDLQHEMVSMLTAAIDWAKKEGRNATPHMQYTRPRVAAKMNAYMWECFAWTVAAGWIGRGAT